MRQQVPDFLSAFQANQKIEQKGGKLENLIQFSKFSRVFRFVIVFTSAVDFGGKTGNLQCLKIT